MRFLTSWVVKLTVSLAFVAYLLHGSKLGAVFTVLHRVDLWPFLVAFGLYLSSQVLSALRWRMIGLSLGFQNPRRDFILFYFFGMFLNLFSPSLLLGDVGRGLFLGDSQGKARAFQTIVVDRSIGLLALVTLAGGALILVGAYPVPHSLQYAVLGFAGFAYAAWWLAPKACSTVLPPGNWLRSLVEENLSPLSANHALGWRTLGVSLVIHLVQVVAVFALSLSAEVRAPFSYLLVCTPLVNFLSALPVTVSGIGIRESGYIFFLGMVGIPREEALGLGLLWLSVVVFSALLGGVLFLLFKK